MQPDLQWRISPPVNNQPIEPIFAPVVSDDNPPGPSSSYTKQSGPSQEEGGNAGSCPTSVQTQVSSSQVSHVLRFVVFPDKHPVVGRLPAS